MLKRKSRRARGRISERIQERAPFPRDGELWQQDGRYKTAEKMAT
jgi:hypothetical protein